MTINILDFNVFSSMSYHKKILIKKEGNIEDDKIEMHVLELKKFLIMPNKLSLTKKEQWMTYLIGDDKIKIDQILRKNDKIYKLNELLNSFWNKEKIE